MTRKKFFITTLFLIPLYLSGCAALLPVSVLTTTSIASDERSLGTIMDDNVIHASITTSLLKYPSNFSAVEVTVLEGRVLLTGTAPRESIREAVKISWSIKGVKEVINELNTGIKKAKDIASDTWIENSIRARFLVEKKFFSTNYKIVVNEGVVFILGIAQNDDEMDRALTMASSIKGVVKVVNHIMLKSDPRRAK